MSDAGPPRARSFSDKLALSALAALFGVPVLFHVAGMIGFYAPHGASPTVGKWAIVIGGLALLVYAIVRPWRSVEAAEPGDAPKD